MANDPARFADWRCVEQFVLHLDPLPILVRHADYGSVHLFILSFLFLSCAREYAVAVRFIIPLCCERSPYTTNLESIRMSAAHYAPGEVRCDAAFVPFLLNSNLKLHSLGTAFPSTVGGVNTHLRAASNA